MVAVSRILRYILDFLCTPIILVVSFVYVVFALYSMHILYNVQCQKGHRVEIGYRAEGIGNS